MTNVFKINVPYETDELATNSKNDAGWQINYNELMVRVLLYDFYFTHAHVNPAEYFVK